MAGDQVAMACPVQIFAIRLTDWCCPGQFIQAIEELYAESIESIEPFGVSDLDQIQKGENAIIVKNK